jgi:hypothetical protein
MNNKRVYLAKSNLASGFDVEYVKSNLLRIPDIEVIDYGTGIRPSECSCLVIVSNSVFNPEVTDTITIGKEISKAMEEFSLVSEIESIVVYCGTEEADHNDVEPNKATGAIAIDTEVNDEEDFKNYATLTVDNYSKDSLLDLVSQAINSFPISAWKSNSRHYQPKAEYAMPPIPTLEERRSAKSKKSHVSSKEEKVEIRQRATGVLLLRSRRR